MQSFLNHLSVRKRIWAIVALLIGSIAVGSGIYLADVDAAVRQQAGRHVLLVAGTGIILLLFAALIARSITQPLRRTVAALHAIGKDKDGLTLRLPVEGGGEIAELASGFNDMLGRLALRNTELAHQRASLEETVAEAVAQRTADLRDSNGRLEKQLAERQQTEQAVRDSRIRLRASAATSLRSSCRACMTRATQPVWQTRSSRRLPGLSRLPAGK